MRGASTSHPHSRPCFGRKTLRRCRNSEEADDDVILIDVDSDHFDNVIIIDVPDSLPKKRKGLSRLKNDKNRPLTVIYIDDDESQDKFNSFAGASSSRSYKSPAEDFEHVDAAENPFIQQNATPVRLSKCKRTYSGKASAGKGYGLNLDSENDSSDSDYADCEVMEDISGKVREQWKKAFYRRKKGIKNDQSGIRSQNGATRVMNDCSHQTVGRKRENEKHMEAPQLFDAGKFSKEDEGTSPLSEGEDAFYNSTNVSVGGSSYRGQHSPSIHIEPEDHQYFEPGTSSWHNENRSFTPGSDAVESVPGESSWFQNSSMGSRDGIDKGFHGENRQTVDVIPLSRNIHVHITDAKVGLFESVSNCGEEDKDDDFNSENGHAVDSVENCMLGEREKLKETDGYRRALGEECASRQKVLKIQAEVAQHSRQLQSKAENGHIMDSVESCIIGEREKFKETDEYKRAMVEELASRQQALKIQAEEAQHLRRLLKRRKTESMRLMDMERRQKERIEEMRSTQKKDEENMNLKEIIRAEVRKELNRLEMACQNLSSLLHAFGIQIEGWPNPSPQEVQTAYKKALLTFHPDRALRSGIRQQVEAEEKFKLINRFKEKHSSFL